MRGRGFVGRRHELECWHEVIGATRRGVRAVLVLAGEPGVGKSALLRRFLADATGAGALAVTACAYEGEWQPAYASRAEVVGAVARTAAGAAALDRLGAAGGPIRRPLPALAPPGDAPSSELPVEQERLRLFDATARVLLAMLEIPEQVTAMIDRFLTVTAAQAPI